MNVMSKRRRWTRGVISVDESRALFTSSLHIKGLKDYPFKGKGVALQREQELDEMRRDLYSYMEEYSQATSAVLGHFNIYLDVVRSKDLPARLRWRSPKVEGGRQNWNVVTENPWVLSRPADVIELVGRTHRRVAEINAVSRMITAERGLIRKYLAMLDSVNTMQIKARMIGDSMVSGIA